MNAQTRLCMCTVSSEPSELAYTNNDSMTRASDFFQDWWAKVTHGAKYGGSFSEMMGPSISTFELYTLPTH